MDTDPLVKKRNAEAACGEKGPGMKKCLRLKDMLDLKIL